MGFGGKALIGMDLDYSQIVVNAKVLIGGTVWAGGEEEAARDVENEI